MKKLLFFVSTVLFVLSCDNGSQDLEIIDINKNISGYVQKGPFISGSRITVQELDRQLNPTGTSFETFTTDDLGSFELSVKLKSEYIEIIASGFYFDENVGKISDANLTLRSIVDVSSKEKLNVNILTTLTIDRLKYLVQEENMDFHPAKNKAQTEVLNGFDVSLSAISEFEDLLINEVGDENAILLGVSILLQQDNLTSELSYLISKINLDLRPDGVISDSLIINELIANAINLDMPQIRKNLEGLYGSDYEIPEFEKYAQSIIYPKIDTSEIDVVSDLVFYFSPMQGDLSGNGNLINPINCSLTTDRKDSSNNAYLLNRDANSFIQLPAGLELREPNWTFCIWAKIDSMGEWDEVSLLANKSTEPGGSAFEDVYLAIDSRQESNGNPSFGEVGAFVNNSFRGTGYFIQPFQWNFYTVSYSPQSIKIYINGQLVKHLAHDFNFQYDLDSPYEIAKRNRRGREFDGAVSDIRLYRRVLHEDEVKHLFLN